MGRDFSVSYSEHTMLYQGKVAAFGKFRDKETEFSVKRQKIFCPLSELTLSVPWISTISGRYDGYFMKDGAVSVEESVFYDFDTGKEIPLSFPVDEQLMGMVSRDEGVLLFTKEVDWGYSNEKNRYQIYEVTKDGVSLRTDSAFL